MPREVVGSGEAPSQTDFLARSRSPTHAGPRSGTRRTVGRAGVWVAAPEAQGRARSLTTATYLQLQAESVALENV
jgi:hypothetical protein